MRDNDDLMRFIDAQDSRWSGYDTALKEIRDGRKIYHWIWYIFPQLRGLGRSKMSHYYGIAGRDEARAYLGHPVLGARLREISEALLEHRDKTSVKIFGEIDSAKVKSCMTLFDSISPDDVFGRVLDQFYGGERDTATCMRYGE